MSVAWNCEARLAVFLYFALYSHINGICLEIMLHISIISYNLLVITYSPTRLRYSYYSRTKNAP